MQDAIDACNKAGIGLIAMKTQAMRQRGPTVDANAVAAEAEADRKMLAHFLEKGFTKLLSYQKDTGGIYNDVLAPFRRKKAWSEKKGILWNRCIIGLIGIYLLFWGLW